MTVTPFGEDDSTGVSLISTYVPGPVTLGSGGYASSLTITNTGTVATPRNDAATGVSGNGTLVNAGVIYTDGLQGTGVSMTNGTVINSGTISGADGVSLENGTVINSGQMGPIFMGDGLILDSGLIRGEDSQGIIAEYGLTLVLEPGFDIASAGVQSGNGTLILSPGIQYMPLYGFNGFSNIDVSADTGVRLNTDRGWLRSYPYTTSTLTGFQPGDTLQIPSDYPATYMPGKGIIISNVLDSAGTATIALDKPPAFGLAFTTISNGVSAAYVDVTAPCFCAGTRIRTPNEDKPVERLAIGDEVVTAFAGIQRIKWIGRRSYEGRFIVRNRDALPICIKAGAIAEGIPARDLWVSPDHAICEGGVLIHAWRLVNGVSIVQVEAVERVEYFHIELEGHHVLFAEDCPAESFLDTDCRERFANVQEHAALYGETEPGKPCLPLVQSGFHLENIRRRLAERAGIAPHTAPVGALHGCLDEVGPERLRGWAQDVSAPDVPVILSVTADGNPFTLVIANEFRTDLRAAGLGSGCHAFSLPFPAGAKRVEIHRASDGAGLAQLPLARAA